MATLEQVKTRLKQAVNKNPRMNIAGMARVAGISERAARRMCDPSDPTRIDLMTIYPICKEYGVSLDYMIFGFVREENFTREAQWDLTLQFWTARLTHNQKALLLEMFDLIWREGAGQVPDTPPPELP